MGVWGTRKARENFCAFAVFGGKDYLTKAIWTVRDIYEKEKRDKKRRPADLARLRTSNEYAHISPAGYTTCTVNQILESGSWNPYPLPTPLSQPPLPLSPTPPTLSNPSSPLLPSFLSLIPTPPLIFFSPNESLLELCLQDERAWEDEEEFGLAEGERGKRKVDYGVSSWDMYVRTARGWNRIRIIRMRFFLFGFRGKVGGQSKVRGS